MLSDWYGIMGVFIELFTFRLFIYLLIYLVGVVSKEFITVITKSLFVCLLGFMAYQPL